MTTARRDPGGLVTLPASGYISIPAALRHRCGLEPGDQVLRAAHCRWPARCGRFALVDQAIRAHGGSRTRKERCHDHPDFSGGI